MNLTISLIDVACLVIFGYAAGALTEWMWYRHTIKQLTAQVKNLDDIRAIWNQLNEVEIDYEQRDDFR